MESISVQFLMIFMNSLGMISYAAIREYGERCEDKDDSCSDHRYICAPVEGGISRCICDRFHIYGGDLVGCIQSVNTSYIIWSSNITVGDNEGRLANETQAIVKIYAGAGLFVTVCAVLAVIITIIFCVYTNLKDVRMENEISKLERMKIEEVVQSRRSLNVKRKSIITTV